MHNLILLLSVRFKQTIRRASSRASMWISILLLLVLVAPFSFLGAFWLHQFLSSDAMPLASLAVLLEVGFAVYLIYAVFSPFFGLHSSDYQDIEKARLYPIQSASLFGAALASGLFTPMMAFLSPSIVVVLRRLAPSPELFLYNTAVFLLFLIFASAARQVVTLAFLNLLKRRRYQDFLRVLAPFLGILVFAGFQFLVYGNPGRLSRTLQSFEIPPWLRETPLFWHARSLVGFEPAGTGLLLRLFLALGTTVALIALGGRLMSRALLGELESNAGSRASGTWDEELQFHLGRRNGIRGPLWGMAAKEFRLIRREPAIKTLIIQQSFLFLFPILILFAQSGFELREMVENGGRILLPTLLILLYVEFQVFYFALGFEGRSMIQLVSQPIPPSAIFLGKNLIYGAAGLLWNTLVVVGLCTLFRQPDRIVPYTLVGVCGLVVGIGWANLSATLFPVPMSTTGRNPLSQSTGNGRGCLLALWTYLNVALLLLFSAPIVGVVLAQTFERGEGSVRSALLALMMGVYSVGLYSLFLAAAGNLFRRRQEQILDLFTRQTE